MTTETKNLYDQTLWNQGYSKLDFYRPDPSDQVYQWLTKWAAHYNDQRGTGGRDCLEIGCFPGRYLYALGKLGFRANGVDLAPRVDREMVEWLKSEGVATGDFQNCDFFKMPVAKQYDFVYSLGFIEHFTHWREALLKHADLVKPGGWLLVATPNFRGSVQRKLHTLLDRENFERHFLPSMDSELWSEVLRAQGFKIIDAGYFASYDFWIGEQKRNLVQRAACLALRAARPILARCLPKNSSAVSPFCGVVAVKTSRGATDK